MDDMTKTAAVPAPDTTLAAQRRRKMIAELGDAELFERLARYNGAAYARHQLRRFILDELAARGLAASF